MSLTINNQQDRVVSFGNFDGVHLGHRHIIKGMQSVTASNNVTVITFDPHPQRFFHPSVDGFHITNLHQKISLLKEYGVNEVHVIPFTEAFASLSAQSFIEDVLVKQCRARYIVVGKNCTFGHRKSGDISLLQKLSAQYNYELVSLDECQVDGQKCSSSRIRQYLKDGGLKGASAILGRHYEITGEVLRGQRRRIGFPTMNIAMQDYMIPRLGVYAARTTIDSHAYHGIVNIGTRPTFSGEDILLEMHVFNFNDDVYGKVLAVQLLDFIRPEQQFASVEALQKQIQQDIQFVKRNYHLSVF